MKGVVFTELLEYVETSFGADVVDEMIESSELPSGGAYTSVGTYDYGEMRTLVTFLARKTGASVPQLLSAFGRHLAHRFSQNFPNFFMNHTSLLDFLESVDSHIHVEVHKLYPDAELPAFRTFSRGERSLELDYSSCRPLAALAEGLIHGASDYYKQTVKISKAIHSGPDGDVTRFQVDYV